VASWPWQRLQPAACWRDLTIIKRKISFTVYRTLSRLALTIAFDSPAYTALSSL
jgi:hypothetical protein